MNRLFLCLLLPLTSQAATLVTEVQKVNSPIPDNNPVGLSSTMSLVTTLTSIENVQVNLDLSNGWSGDIYCYLIHGSGFSVLLNRIGRSLLVPEGASNSGLLLTLFDGAANDVHTGVPGTGPVAGSYQPDGRNVSPSNSLNTTVRTAPLSVFTGLDANGEWTLFVADVAAGETMTLNSWSMTLNGVPEPAVGWLAALGLSLGLRRRRG